MNPGSWSSYTKGLLVVKVELFSPTEPCGTCCSYSDRIESVLGPLCEVGPLVSTPLVDASSIVLLTS